ncbi:MSP domain protein [Dictyocaulus viviparus]|uniref:Major sperm protein n=1 Tax=Dictyocaulus viviparus TaxID=29172 RepID=A0A0D8XSP7_DICVI|nr:MSP domain protein [Dictyocaulus viviparus]
MLLWINFAQYRPGDTGFENVFVFWLERHTMETKGTPLTILLDMSGTSMKNMDFNIFKFIFHVLKYYYPDIVHDMIVFESPPILNASWKVDILRFLYSFIKISMKEFLIQKICVKIMKSWLDPAHPQIHFLTKDTITRHVDKKNLPPHMGGEDNFKFTMDDLVKCLPASQQNGNHSNISDGEYCMDRDGFDSFMKKGVTFDDDDDEANRKAPLTLCRKTSNLSIKRGIPECLKPVVEARLRSPEVNWIKNAFLEISPRDVLNLNRVDNVTDFVDVVVVRNTSQIPVMFKIKTTSPEKFRVRPTMGIILPESTEIIRVYLQNEYKNSCTREKFLLMALESENNNLETFGELWKNTHSERKVEQKLRCRLNNANLSDGYTNDNIDGGTNSVSQQGQIDRLRAQCEVMQRTQFILIIIMLMLFFILIVIVVNERWRFNALETTLNIFSNKLNTTECDKTSADKQLSSRAIKYEDEL